MAHSTSKFGHPKRIARSDAVQTVEGGLAAANLPSPSANDIAIIGLAGRYPMAADLDQLWQNLKNGRDCVTEIPQDRWDHAAIFSPKKGEVGKTYSKWGGFLDGVDCFDPRFFNISPREAEIMDPQERLFLQCAYSVIEDAGYTRQALADVGDVGVFVGVQYTEYTAFSNSETIVAALPASIANRVSYFCGLQGPSITIDTMCSSSLTTVHLACQSLQSGESRYAIAGGVNVSIHPNKYLLHAQGRFASSIGRCKTFGQGGDGYVPAEGVGAVLLKPLADAIADRDHIYGVIKGTAINHGGRATGFTVPKSTAQAAVLSMALKRARVSARGVGYLEAHGTGTALGDLIEMEGLCSVFAQDGVGAAGCAIGSIKSNIGHCESAAGIAGLTKVLLQFKHGQLVPSLHSHELNRNIDFDNSPFHVQQCLAPWPRQSCASDGQVALPRIAGISSFGAGGANAHVVVEEYIARPEEEEAEGQAPVLIVLSAKNSDRLRERAIQLRARLALDRALPDGPRYGLRAVAYTLQTGREALEERLGFVTESWQALDDKLAAFIELGHEASDIVTGRVVKKASQAHPSSEGAEDLAQAAAQGQLETLLRCWANGADIDWQQLNRNSIPEKVSLPTYPFAQERYWVPPATRELVHSGGTQCHITPSLLHRLADSEAGHEYVATLGGDEFFLDHHRIDGRKILPGVVYLELARAALLDALAGRIEVAELALRNVVWSRPFVSDGRPADLHLMLTPSAERRFSFEFYQVASDSGASVRRLVFCRGEAELGTATSLPSSLLDEASLPDEAWTAAAAYYDRFHGLGIDYGPGHRGLQAIRPGLARVAARLQLPAFLRAQASGFGLHPCLLDSALQASIAFSPVEPDEARCPLVPFSLDEIRFPAPTAAPRWAVLSASVAERQGTKPVQAFDVDLYDEHGRLCIKMTGYASRSFKRVKTSPETAVSLLVPAPATAGQPSDIADYHFVFLCEPDLERSERARQRFPSAHLVTLDLRAEPGLGIDARYEAYALTLLRVIQQHVKEKPPGKTLLQLVVDSQGEAGVFAGLFGLLRTVAREHADFDAQWLTPMLERVAEHWVPLTETREASGAARPVWKDRGVYLFTGGMGGLGQIFAEDLARHAENATLILLGRASLGEAQKQTLDQLQARGLCAHYLTVDVADDQALELAVHELVERFGRIDGVLHIAGVLEDKLLREKSEDSLMRVLAPKVRGTVNLDRATQDLSLDFIALFSSLSGVFGHVGQADYACANAFMDAFARWRNTQVATGRRSGLTVAIDWPFWRDGGMTMRPEALARLREQTGLTPLGSDNGVRALHVAIRQSCPRLLVLEGVRAELETFCARLSAKQETQPDVRRFGIKASVAPYELADHLTKLIATILKIEAADVDVESELTDMGFDSVTLVELAGAIRDAFGQDVAPELFYEYSTVTALARHLGACSRVEAAPAVERMSGSVERAIKEIMSAVLKVPANAIDSEGQWEDYGLDSVTSAQVVAELNRQFGIELPAGVLLDHATIGDFAVWLGESHLPVETPTVPSIADASVLHVLRALAGELLKTAEAELDTETDLYDYGFDSVLLTEFINEVNRVYRLDTQPADLLDLPAMTLCGVADFLVRRHGIRDILAAPAIVLEPVDLGAQLTVAAAAPERESESEAILLSAPSEAQLRAVAGSMVAIFSKRPAELIDLHTLALTSQSSGALWGKRMGVVVDSVPELIGKLNAYLGGETSIPGLYTGDASANHAFSASILADADLRRVVDGWLAGRKLTSLLEFWSKGLEIDWTALRQGEGTTSVDASWHPVSRLSEQPQDAKLFCVPAAGASAAIFYPLARALETQVEVYGFDYRGLVAPWQAHDTMGEMVSCYVDAMLRVQPQGPYLILGHSFGATIAFEMTRTLEALGSEVVLFMLDSLFYASKDKQNQDLLPTQLDYFLGDGGITGKQVAQWAVRSASDEETIEGLTDARQRQAQLLARQVKMSINYQPSGHVAGTVLLILSANSILGEANLDETLGRYARYLSKTPRVSTVAGTHMSMLSSENVASLASVLLTYLTLERSTGVGAGEQVRSHA
ncbi:SDR family NAD(P)-dependent oxidoreductase [Chromobacterium sp. IIBBL 290-4]|uniref:SDR family NAD(P)-dependent oxidoreductase n=1 Tax=Chromobacterium sp. IIBBL 290-4 TaxID=2953890 RepID=UPI0020B72FDE|nr:SDR family NAD(P)-dependent oxidoreductase [Chromobacterium sp. IIBBL 290-4]UTH76433.1 SDR family NAD(P)-dependent oxidoreductase [Chromobacterium sp. IIBBL 290-4]